MKRPLLTLPLLLSLLWTASPAVAETEITLVAAGDLMLAGSAAPVLDREGFAYPFDGTRSFVDAADLAVANLEAPLTGSTEEFLGKTYRFKAPPEAAGAISEAGFDVLTLANNHMGDFGEPGILETLTTLDAAGIAHTGAGRNLAEARRAAIVAVKGQAVAFLAYSNTFPKEFWAGKSHAGTAPGWADLVRRDVARARRAADYVVVSFHWGAELMTEPKDYQRELGHLAIDSGAQVVLGHHPHVLQGIEHYRGGVICYSLGNYAFGSYSKNSRTSALARITLDAGTVAKTEILPLDVFNPEVAFRPQPLIRGGRYAFARDFAAQCTPLGTSLKRQCNLFWTAVPTPVQPSALAPPTPSSP